MGEGRGEGGHSRRRYGAPTRTVTPLLPAESARAGGLAYTLWRAPPPAPAPTAGVVVLHGAGSCKESHHDFARAAVASGLAVLCFDQRGHGESDGPMDGGAIDDAAAMVAVLRRSLGDPSALIALRGSSMGGYLAILAAARLRASAVVAICPASADGLRRALGAGSLRFDARVDELEEFLDGHDIEAAARALSAPLLLLHAEGDEQVPVQHSRELIAAVSSPGSRLITVPGGHHRSIQHDEELQAVSLRFLLRALGAGGRASA